MRIEEEETEKRDTHLLGHVLKKEVRERFLLKHLKRSRQCAERKKISQLPMLHWA